MKNVLIIGATSAIAGSIARRYATKNSNLFLVARDSQKISAIRNDLLTRGANQVEYYLLDVNDVDLHEDMLLKANEELDSLDVVIVAHGTLPDQTRCEKEASIAISEFNTNATSTIALLTQIANHMEKKGSGVIAVITSVAGERGRSSNYLYGAAKAAVSTFLDGLRIRLLKSGVTVIDIKPGFVDTPMTQNLALPSVLTADPDTVSSDILKAIVGRKQVIYTPFFWKYIMLIIKSVPRFIFNKLSI